MDMYIFDPKSGSYSSHQGLSNLLTLSHVTSCIQDEFKEVVMCSELTENNKYNNQFNFLPLTAWNLGTSINSLHYYYYYYYYYCCCHGTLLSQNKNLYS